MGRWLHHLLILSAVWQPWVDSIKQPRSTFARCTIQLQTFLCIRTDAITWYAIRQVRNRASAGFAQWHPATAATGVPV